jgi:hypothetical protein
MKLYPNWKAILKKCWSIRFMALAGLLSGCEVVLPLFSDAIPRSTFAVLSFLAVGGAFVSRLVAQEGIYESK